MLRIAPACWLLAEYNSWSLPGGRRRQIYPGVRVHPHNFRDIFAIHRIVRRAKRECYEHAHTFIIGCAPGVEVNPILGSIGTDRQILETLIARSGAHAASC